MDVISICTAGRQFPDKAIDLIDEACATANKKMRQINRLKEEMNTTKSSSANALKKAIITPDHVAQVGIIFLIIFVSIVAIDESCLT